MSTKKREITVKISKKFRGNIPRHIVRAAVAEAYDTVDTGAVKSSAKKGNRSKLFLAI